MNRYAEMSVLDVYLQVLSLGGLRILLDPAASSVFWCCGLVVDTLLWNQKLLSLSPGFTRSTLSPWERFFTCPHCTQMQKRYLAIGS